MTKILRAAVIGLGYLGKFHAEKYHKLKEAHLIGLCDLNPEVCKPISEQLNNVPIYTDYKDLFGKVDAVSIATTTSSHYEIAADCIKAGIHVLLEKPMTKTVAQAKELIELAKKHKVKLQIGHLERFNAAHIAVKQHLHKPLFIESQRLAPFNPRGTDVNVVLDLMIHDIDIIQALVASPIAHIEAQGVPVLSQLIDIANARITFANKCVANVTASRISFKTERKTRIFQHDNYISIDYHQQKCAVFTKCPTEQFPGIPEIIQHKTDFEKNDDLLEEIKSFIYSILNDTIPMVTAEDGCASLETSEQIINCIHANLEDANATA